MAQDTSPQVTGPLRTTSPADVYPTHKSTLGLGGYRELATLAERNAIPTERRAEGMLVYTASDQTIWLLKPAPWDGTNADWESAFDAGDIGVISIEGGGTGATTVHAARVNLGAVTALAIPIPGNDVLTQFDLAHNANFALTQEPTVIEVATGLVVKPTVTIVSGNVVRVNFGDPPAAGEFTCVILGLEA